MTSPNNVLVGTWTLDKTSKSPAEAAFTLTGHADSPETAFDDDQRVPVDPKDFLPNGKYGAIVKLQMRYQGQKRDDDRWAQGTGWLITNDILVTAGHCVFDWTHGFGKATEIKAYTGYNGKESIGKGTVQFRQGRRIATPRGWLASAANRDNDVAFIQVDQPFKNITPFKFATTPSKAAGLQVGVVGYPADKKYKGEIAAQMYQQFGSTSFDLTTSVKHMLEYKVSTFAGQSGSPVLMQKNNTSIGAHVYGLGTVNSASAINGTWGNPYAAYVDSFNDESDGEVNSFGTRYIKVPLSAVPQAPEEEGFWQTLGKIVKIGSTVGAGALQAGTPFLGPSGQAIAAAAGAALNFASKMTDSSMKAESTLDVSYDIQGPVSRSVMAEAALQTVLDMDEDQLEKYKIFDTMQAVYNKQKPNIASVTAQVMPAVMDPALRIAVYTSNKKNSLGAESGGLDYPPMSSVIPSDAKQLTRNEQEFVTQMTKYAEQNEAREEGFLDFLGSVAKTALSVVSPIGSIVSGLLRAEASLDEPAPIDPNLETLTQRAVMADAALQALLKVPAADMQEEGFFGSLIGIVKKVAPVVMQVAPSIVSAVAPVVKNLLKSSPESAFGKEKMNKSVKKPVKVNLPINNKGPLKKKPSLAERLANANVGGVSSAASNDVVDSAAQFDDEEVLEPQRDGLAFA